MYAACVGGTVEMHGHVARRVPDTEPYKAALRGHAKETAT
jgi:hypothetical protein